MTTHRFRIVPSARLARAVALAGLALTVAAAASAEPRLTLVSGEVEIGRGEPPSWRLAREGEALGPGDQVRTGNGARAELQLGNGVARLYANSLLRLPADAMGPDGPAAVGLERGGSLFDVESRRPADPFEVRTPEVVASVKGTRFGVFVAEAGAAVNVYEGLVGVRRGALEAAREMLVREGFGAVGAVGAIGSFELLLLPAGDPWQGWSQGAPAPALPATLGASAAARIDEARMAAQREARPDLLAQLAERDSKPAPAGEKAAGAVGEALPARIDDTAVKPERTPLDPALRKQDSLPPGLQVEVAESLLNGTAPALQNAAPPSGPTASLLSVELVTQGGPNHVVISDAQGTLADLTVKEVETILNTGDPSLLGTPVLNTLSSTGVDPRTFTEQLQGLLH